ncbi:hypothetical protein ACS0TY_027511 [Phlomoides rotata]
MEKLASSDGRQPQLEIGGTSIQDDIDDVEEKQLVRHRRRHVTLSSTSTDAPKDAEEVGDLEVNLPSSPQPNDDVHHLQQNENDFPSDEWGGISSVEHDEAVMLEAAMFGGIPEGTGFHFPYAPHQLMQNADREKELKAKEEAEAAFVEQRLKEAFLPQEPTPDDESAIILLVRMPDGSRRGRRFLKSDKLQVIWLLVKYGFSRIMIQDLGDPSPQPVQSHLEDTELARAVSLSLQTAEKKKVLREQEGKVGTSELEA